MTVMTIKYVRGDLLKMAKEGRFDIIIHGCNIYHTFGAGIAAQIKRQFPEAYEADLTSPYGDPVKMGMFTMSSCPDSGVTVVNLYTQKSFSKGEDVLDYDALYKGLVQLKMILPYLFGKDARIGIPQIGAGLARGDWSIISRYIEKVGFEDITCVLYR